MLLLPALSVLIAGLAVWEAVGSGARAILQGFGQVSPVDRLGFFQVRQCSGYL